MDDNPVDILRADFNGTFEFFYKHLSGLVGRRDENVEHEVKYVASILANYGLTSVGGGGLGGGVPLESDLNGVFDNYILLAINRRDPELMEAAGAQTLLLIGFFRDQQVSRHRESWFLDMGEAFFRNASELLPESNKKKLLHNIAVNFKFWADTLCKLNKTFKSYGDDPYLIKLDDKPKP